MPDNPLLTPFRKPTDLRHLWHGQPRSRLIEVCKNMGITDICTCEPFLGMKNFRYRPGSSSNPNASTDRPLGMYECRTCHYLLNPLRYLYDCDECTEPFLIDKVPPPRVNQELLCFDCALER